MSGLCRVNERFSPILSTGGAWAFASTVIITIGSVGKVTGSSSPLFDAALILGLVILAVAIVIANCCGRLDSVETDVV